MQTEVRGVELSHETSGSGRPFVWGHGLTSSRADEAKPPVMIEWDRMPDEVNVTRYDARGHGQSGFTTEPEGYAWSELARDQIELLDKLGIEQTILGGASMGAATALHSAVQAPERVDALVLVIPPTGWETRASQRGMYHQMADIIDSRGVELLISAGAAIAPPDPFVEDPTFKERGANRLREADPVRLAGVFRGASTAELPSKEEVAGIDVPTLILAWTGDTGHPVSTAELLVELMPNTELAIAPSMEEFATWTDRTIEFVCSH